MQLEIEQIEDNEYKLNECRIHWSLNGGKCSKCSYLGGDKYQKLIKEGLQYNGVPWVSLLTNQDQA